MPGTAGAMLIRRHYPDYRPFGLLYFENDREPVRAGREALPRITFNYQNQTSWRLAHIRLSCPTRIANDFTPCRFFVRFGS